MIYSPIGLAKIAPYAVSITGLVPAIFGIIPAIQVADPPSLARELAAEPIYAASSVVSSLGRVDARILNPASSTVALWSGSASWRVSGGHQSPAQDESLGFEVDFLAEHPREDFSRWAVIEEVIASTDSLPSFAIDDPNDFLWEV